MPWFLLEIIKYYKKSWFFSIVVKGILLYKNVLYLFFKIIYFMKTLTKLVDSNMEVHGFFELRRDTTGAWSVFRFFNSSWMPRTTDAKIDQRHKKVTFLKSVFLFHPFERKHTAERLFKFVIFVIFGVPSLEIMKNPWFWNRL